MRAPVRRWVVAVAAALVLAACGSTDTTSLTTFAPDASLADATADTALGAVSLPATFANQGGEMEGHTPRGFAGSGTGLFLGDNLNPGFPDGDGVQLWLTFDVVATVPSKALLSSESLVVAGAPFDDLGAILVAPVSYVTFGPDVFDLKPIGAEIACERAGESALECDVTEAVAAAAVAGQRNVQFRLRFEQVTDSDGEPDLAMFFQADSNTNEPGLFALIVS